MLYLIPYLLITVLFVYYLITRKKSYWDIRGVPNPKPSFIFGNYKPYILLQKYIGHVAQDICKKFPDEPYIGTYFGTEPALIVQDPELIKLVLTKEFYYFSGREITKYYDRETVTNCMFFCGGDTWKILHQNSSPMFSTRKMKNMFYLIQHCIDTFEEVLKVDISKNPLVEAKNLATRFIMECVGSCVFGVNTEILRNNDKTNPFKVIGQEIYSKSTPRAMKLVIRSMWPYIFYKLRFQLFAPEISSFFHETLTKVFQSRDYKPTSRNDFVDLVLSWNNEKYLKGSSMNPRSEDSTPVTMKVNNDMLIAQCVQFFGAGFETSSTLISFTLFELAKNKEAQAKLIQEVDAYLLKYNDKIEYECIYELPYLEACLEETMRLYPVFGLLTRETMDDFTLPSGLRLEKGLRIHIPVYHLHFDPKYFPEPEEFRPERFIGEEKKNIAPYTFLPFGEGPRLCIGKRFSKMQVYPALIIILKDYDIELAEGMPSKIDFVPGGFVTQAAGGIHLKFNKRRKN